MNRFYLIRREIINWIYLRKVIKKAKKPNDSLWFKFKLRSNWYGRIYTIISLREQDMGEEETVRNFKAMEMMRPISEYLTTLGIQEIVFPSIEVIPNSRSYLIVYSPIFNNFSYKWLFIRLFYISSLIGVAYIIYKKIVGDI